MYAFAVVCRLRGWREHGTVEFSCYVQNDYVDSVNVEFSCRLFNIPKKTR